MATRAQQRVPRLTVVAVLQKRQKLSMQTLHSVFNLAGSKHITDALTCFGVTDASTTLLVARFDASAGDLATLRALVKGTEVDVAGLEALRDQAAMRKAFKCSDQELHVGSLCDAALCKFAARDC